MKKQAWLTIAVALGIGALMLLAACGSSSPSTTTGGTTTPPVTTTTSTTPPTTTTSTTPASNTITVGTSSTLGQYLADGSGMTLYWTTADSPGVSNVSGTNLTVWPVFYTASISVPASLSAGDFGSITRSDGTKQTTFKNWPLYYFHNDTAAGQTNGQGVGGKWSVATPGGSGPQPVTTTPPTTTTTTSTTPPVTTTTTTAGSSTYGTLAAAGQATYTQLCSSCHGPNGGGTDICPVVMWGQGATLGTFNGVTLFTDAQGLYNYMSKSMPLTAPGSLTQAQYDGLLAFILTQAGKVSGTATFDTSTLASIAIP